MDLPDVSLTGPACGAPGQGAPVVGPGAQSVDAMRSSQERQSGQSTPSAHRCQPCQSEGAATRSRSPGLFTTTVSVPAALAATVPGVRSLADWPRPQRLSARRAAVRSVLAFPVVSEPPAFSRCARMNQ